jgi:hypothetical protein
MPLPHFRPGSKQNNATLQTIVPREHVSTTSSDVGSPEKTILHCALSANHPKSLGPLASIRHFLLYNSYFVTVNSYSEFVLLFQMESEELELEDAHHDASLTTKFTIP